MNFALVAKTLRDSWWLVLLVLGGLLIFEVLFVRAIGDIDDRLGNELLRLPLIKNVLRVLLGADLAKNLNSTGVMTLGFSNSFLYALTWLFLLTYCTRVIAGEIDRGTADLTLTLPISRWAHYLSVTVVWVLAGPLICLTPLAGVFIGTSLFPLRDPIHWWSLGKVSANLFALYVAVGGLTMLVSALVSRRGLAIGIVLSILLGAVLLNTLQLFWEEGMKRFAFLGLLYYYKPLPIVGDGRWPLYNISVLSGVGVLGWIGGALYFFRRDIPAA